MNNPVIIETVGLTKVFDKLVAVGGLDLRVHRGSIHGFIGPNGAGKSTTIKMLVGAVHVTGGEGFIGGYPIGSIEARRLCGYSPERPLFYADMMAWDYLVYIGCLSDMEIGAAEKRTRELLIWLDLGRFRNTKVGVFSAGMKQRLGLAQAMMHQPKLLILDEPTANLDPDGRMSLMEKLRELRCEQGLTIFISSHILPELEQLIDTVTLIDKGRTVAEDSILNLKRKASMNHYVINTTSNNIMLEMLQSATYIQEARLDTDGMIHLMSDDLAALQARIIEILTTQRILMKYFGEEQVSLQDIYLKTMPRKK